MPFGEVNMAGRIKSGEGTLIGNAGEYFVVAELLKQGVIAALAPRNAPAFDILATNQDKTVRIRVKTKTEEYDVWQWSAKKMGASFGIYSQRMISLCL
jgi:Holliday junction resolvase-like predicted endonuclease